MELSGLKPEALKNLGLDVAMEKIRDALGSTEPLAKQDKIYDPSRYPRSSPSKDKDRGRSR
jgi:hypothetical protein